MSILNLPVGAVGFNTTAASIAPHLPVAALANSTLTPEQVHNFLTGPTILGNFVNWGLFGVLSLQVYLYYSAFPKDKGLVKIVAYGLFLVQTVQLGLSSFDAYTYILGGPNAPIRGIMWFTAPIMGGFVAALVQCFFAWRIALLSGSKVIAIIITIIATLQFIVSIAAGVFMVDIKEIGNGLFASVAGWLILSVFCDVLIAITMLILLIKARGGIAATDVMLSRLITLTIETGALTAAGVVINALLFWYLRDGGFYVLRPAAGVFLGNLYANTLLVNLNQRMKIEGGRERTQTTADSWSVKLDTTRSLEFNNSSKGGKSSGYGGNTSTFGNNMVANRSMNFNTSESMV